MENNENKGKIKAFKIILTILAVATITGILIYLFPVIKEISTTEGQLAFKDKVDGLGIWGILLLFGLQAAQVFLFIIPGEPIEILAGMCYGTVWGTVFIIVSNLIISCAIFLMVRKFGKKFVYNFNDKEKISKIENSKLFQNPKKIEYIMLILFLIPGTPKDLITYLAGLLPIRFRNFILISNIARFPSIISSTLAGANIAVGDFKMSIILYLAILVIVGICILIINKLDKDKTTEDIIKVMMEK